MRQMMNKSIMILIIISVLILGCTPDQKKDQDKQSFNLSDFDKQTKDNETSEDNKSISEEPKELSCEEKAKALVPKRVTLSLASNHDPDSGYWTPDEELTWTNEETIFLKGDISYQKGRHTGENTNYWYTRNIQNENLFGVGRMEIQ